MMLWWLLPIAGLNASPLGINPDCNEKKVTVDEIKKIADSEKNKTMLDFLRNIPEGSLQTFTFVYGTKSLQHHLVDERWPRVLRMSADGKIVLSFICNKESQDYGSVEVLYFENPPNARWRSMSLVFEKPELKFKEVTATSIGINRHRVHIDPPVCTNCHGTGQNLRAIFPAYPNWPGFFGSEDDTLFKNEKELSQFHQFKNFAANNPCFQTLPWPKKLPPGYNEYPYNSIERLVKSTEPYEVGNYLQKLKIDNYHIRANLKFTDALSHLNAQRIAYTFLRHKDYSKVAPLLAMESLSCKNLNLGEELSKVLGPSYTTPSYVLDASGMDPRSPDSRTLHLYSVGKVFGLGPQDWTLHFNRPDDPEYATGIQGAHGHDISIAAIVQGLLFEDTAKTVPELKGNFKLSRGVSAFFKSQNFSCIDDLGGEVEFDAKNQEKMCATLAKVYQAGYTTSKISDLPALASAPENLSLKMVVEKINLVSNISNIKDGEKNIQTYCTACHTKNSYLPPAYHFFSSNADLKRKMQTDPQFLFKSLAYIENGRMPFGYQLSNSDRQSIQSYLINLAQGAK
ncbi:MAG: hypothetical protein A4S09_10225 [Proteobacteria bacterium SG_bin7]|nr:MAG: hypothetical protein A4S09_10225 [Proteobacteria bacterium SG_bin7]